MVIKNLKCRKENSCAPQQVNERGQEDVEQRKYVEDQVNKIVLENGETENFEIEE